VINFFLAPRLNRGPSGAITPGLTRHEQMRSAKSKSDPSSNDSAILATLSPGAYTALVSGASNDSGVALVEIYEVP